MREQLKTWVAGRPAAYATPGERRWKELLAAQVPTAPGWSPSGIAIEFTIDDAFGWPTHPDVDNLWEPVFSTVINRLGWFGGSRPCLDWYLATKRAGADPGARISILSESAPEVTTVLPRPVFAATWPGPLPMSARDDPFVTWVRDQEASVPPGTLAVALEFGGSRVNLGDVATGRVKNVIDGLQPVLGGPFGNPDDHRIVLLLVVRRASGVADGAVRVAVGPHA